MDYDPPGSSVQADYWSGLPCPPPGDLPNPGIKPWSPTMQVNSLPSEPPRKPKNTGMGSLSLLHGTFPTQKLNQGSPVLQVYFLPVALPGKPWHIYIYVCIYIYIYMHTHTQIHTYIYMCVCVYIYVCV